MENNQSIHKLKIDNKNITLVGTAHVSKKSVELVEKSIDEENPDTIAVELCESRFKSITDSNRWRNMDIVKIIKEKKMFVLLINLILASFQKKIADKFGIKPGQEMITAIEKSKEKKIDLILIDRDVNVTLSRFWRSMSFFTKIKIFFGFLFSILNSEEIEEEDIEKMKDKDALQNILIKLEKSYPILNKILIRERDMYLAEKIKQSSGQNIVAVVGAGHINGIKKYLFQDINLSELEKVPPPSKTSKIIKWLLPAIIIFIFLYGFFMNNESNTGDMLKWWIIANSSMAGLGALIAFAHPLTILSAIVSAPITSLNPMIAAGWVAGLTEAFIKKPKVKDFENIQKDISSIKGFWKNKVTRILLIAVLTNIGSGIGTMVALPMLIKISGYL